MIIIIDGVIGWEYTTNDFRKALDEAAGDDLDIEISSPGGSVYDGNTIYDLILKYKKDYPNAKVTITSFGISASMASIISLAGDEHHVYENTTYIIHNPWSLEIGDYNDMRKTADILERLAIMSARIYAEKSKKSIKEIREKMDNETYFYGQEILDYGLADKILKTDEESDKQEKIALARAALKTTLQKMKNTKGYDYKKDISKIAAKINIDLNKKIDKELKIPASAGKYNQTEVIMNLEEFKKNYPDLYAQIVQIGIDEERDRVKAHLTLAEQANCLDIAVKHIEDGTGFTSSISAEYMAAGMKNTAIQSRVDDNVNIGSQAGDDDEVDTKAFIQKLNEYRGIK